jgi:polysaccharide biosynthesis/export protein
MKNLKRVLTAMIVLGLFPLTAFAQTRAEQKPSAEPTAPPQLQTGSDEISNLNQALAKHLAMQSNPQGAADDYAMGPNDLIEISVFGIPDLSRVVRISNQGTISLPLIGAVRAGGLTVHGLEAVIAELLRTRKYVNDPQVSIFIREFQSRHVAVYGAVKKPGIIPLQSPRTLIDVLVMAEGFREDAGDYVTVRRHGAQAPESSAALDEQAAPSGTATAPEPASPEATTERDDIIKIKISDLISSNDSKYNLIVEPGDVVNVAKAGMVYVTGAVVRPGGFVLKERESITVLQAVSLAEGIRFPASTKSTRIIRQRPDGQKEEIPFDLGKVLEGKADNIRLQNEDVLFIPVSAAKGALRRSAEAILQTATGVLIYR